MKSFALDVPAMYGDHHVVEVRRILLELPGVEDVNASSAFRAVEISFDADRTSEDAIRQVMEQAGYLADLDVPLETGEPAQGPVGNGKTFFRHTAAREALDNMVAFQQQMPRCGQPLWPCPGAHRTEKVPD